MWFILPVCIQSLSNNIYIYYFAPAAFTLICKVTGNPRPKVTWNVRGTTIRDDNDKYQVTSEGLVIKNITQNDKGAYKCNARQLDEDIADFQDMIIQLLIEREYIQEYELFFTGIFIMKVHL